MPDRRALVALALALAPFALAACPSAADDATDDDGGAGTGPVDTSPILDGGGGLPAVPDGAAACPSGACNYQTGAGCPADAGPLSCVPYPYDGGVVPACIAAGVGKSGTACSQWTDCASGFLCAEGACHKLCCGGDWTGCPVGEHCLRPLAIPAPGGDGTIDTGAELCFPVDGCDALAPSSCDDPNLACQIVDPTGATACIREGPGSAGEACPCRGGFACVGGACRRLCKAVQGGGDPACPLAEGRCVHFDRDPLGVGECTPM